MEEAFIAYLLADAGVAALAGGRVYWSERPQGTDVPAIVLFKISPGRDVTLAGPSGLQGPRIQADCLGRTYGEAKRLARAVTAGADAIGGQAGFQGAFIDSERDDFEGAPPERLFRTSLDIIVWRSAA